MSRFFVTGTDTDAGKTTLGAMLAASRPGTRAVKPLATGVPDGEPGDDAVRLARAAGHEPAVFATWPDPLSPEAAARAANRDLNWTGLVAWLARQEGNPLLVEGVGGWRVPLGGGRWVRDLAEAAVGPGGNVIVAAPNRLGVINHALLTVEALTRDGFRAAALFLVDFGPADPSQAINAEDLRRWAPCPVARAFVGTAPDPRLWDALDMR